MKFGDVHNFLKAIQKFDERAVVAGGYLRDIMLGVQPKDVDIWIYNRLPKELVLDLPPDSYKVLRRIPIQNSFAMKRIISVEWKGITFDIIQLRDPTVRAIDRFDFGLNQAWYDGTSIHTTLAFDKDQRDETITYLNNSENYTRLDRIIKDRIPRMIAKYPTYKVVGLERNGDEYYLAKWHIGNLWRSLLRKKELTLMDQLCIEKLRTEGYPVDREVQPVEPNDLRALIIRGQWAAKANVEHNPSQF